MKIYEFQRRLHKARGELKSKLLPFHRDAALIAREEREKGFKRSESPTGDGWAKLDPKTIRQKRGEHKTVRVYRKKRGGPSGLAVRKAKASKQPEKPLIDTGALMKPTVKATIRSGKVIMARSRGEAVSTAGSIAKIHNEGTKKIPKREHWGIYPNAEDRIADAWNELLVETARTLSK